ncbi:hypothetical protein PR048_016297 [Dryococelus australis]|uniref:Uncharacterized protein n=1 Tax=Dryococelus australis TaxID=614101 RepID=A0ABQ9HJS7_9NEOP|nr:hypothetical protein PR048_016297 [Dryococelus australis]
MADVDKNIPFSISLTTDIIEATKNSNTTKTESSVDENGDSADETDITWSEAAATWDTILKFSKSKKDCYSLSEVMQYRVLHSTFLHKRRLAIKQSNIRTHMVKQAMQKPSQSSVPTSGAIHFQLQQ